MTAETSFAAEAAAEMLKTLQSWWEIPSIAQYISLFREPFNIPEIEIEELEEGFIDDTVKGPSTWLKNLIIAFLRSIMPGRINAENWEDQLRKLVKRKLVADEPNPFEEDKAFHELRLRNKVEIVYSLCLHRLDRNDIVELMKSMDAEALRVQKLGVDEDGNTYWYFYGTRLYKEETVQDKKSWDEEWKKQKQKFQKKRGRGRPRKRMQTSDGDSYFEDNDLTKNDGYMNANEKSRWSVVCDTIEEWVTFAEKFKNSKSKNEISLFKIIQESFLPTLNEIYKEKERKLQQKIKELMPLPKREKIVTRREGRKMRGEIIESPLNGYYDDEAYKMHTVKDRARRLEERNKRASEVDCIQVPARSKRMRDYISDQSFDQEDEEEFIMPNLPSTETSDIDWQSELKKLLSSIKLHKDAWPFLHPVDDNDAPGYYEIIQDPIALSTIESRLYEGQYDSLQDLDNDFNKLVTNCKMYNGESHPYSKMVKTLRKMFHEGLTKIMESAKPSECIESEGSSDSQYSYSSNSSSSPPDPHRSSRTSKKSKDRKKKKHKNMEALELLAEASDLALQDNFVNRTSPPKKKSPVPQQIQANPQHVPSSNMPYNTATTASSSISKTTILVTSPKSVPTNNLIQKPKKDKQVIIRNTVAEIEKRVSPVENNASTSLNVVSSTNSMPQNNINNIYQPISAKTVPVVFSGYNPTSSPGQTDLRFKNNPVTMQSNVCMSNGLPVMQQVIIPAGSQSIQVPTNQQIVFAQPQNTVRLFNKDQNVQILNNVNQVNQSFGKVIPQLIASGQVMQVSKEVMPGLQYQTVSGNNTQTFAQVTQNPQFVSIPTYMITNQNTVSDPSQQSVMNIQHYQLSQRQMQINGQGN